MRNTVSQSELMAPERSLTVALKSSSATHTNWYLSLIAGSIPNCDEGKSCTRDWIRCAATATIVPIARTVPFVDPVITETAA